MKRYQDVTIKVEGEDDKIDSDEMSDNSQDEKQEITE